MAHTLAPVTGLRVKGDTVRPYYAPSARGRGGMQDVRYISEARKLFEKFVRDVEKLQAQQEQDIR